MTQPAHVAPAASSGWNVVAGTARRVVLASAVVHEVGLYDDEHEALTTVSSYLDAAFSAPGQAPDIGSSSTWLSSATIDKSSPVYPALVAGPDQIVWTNGVPNAADGASVAFDLRVVEWSGGGALLSQWAPVAVAGPWIASLPSPSRPAYLDLSSKGALLAAFMPFAVEYGAAITDGGRVVDEHWDVYSYAELRPGRGGALSLYSPLVHALVWSQVVPSLPSSPSYVHSVVDASPPPAGAVTVSLG
ncbi:MAG: hypothetical protein ACYCWW_13325 [Deltaproteobacteria bacterium]